MGDIADAFLDGTFCQICGEFMGDNPGYPQVCGTCEAEDGGDGDERIEADRKRETTHIPQNRTR